MYIVSVKQNNILYLFTFKKKLVILIIKKKVVIDTKISFEFYYLTSGECRIIENEIFNFGIKNAFLICIILW